MATRQSNRFTKAKTKPKAKPELKKPAGGRPTKYLPQFSEQARKLALMGWVDVKLAEFFGVSESTLNLWKQKHPEFSESLKLGREGADQHVVSALYQSALGGGTITETITDSDGVTTKVKQVQPNVTAQIFWLKNRQPEHWRDKAVIEDETPLIKRDDLDAIFVEAMRKSRERGRQILIDRVKAGIITDYSEDDLRRHGITPEDLERKDATPDD